MIVLNLLVVIIVLYLICIPQSEIKLLTQMSLVGAWSIFIISLLLLWRIDFSSPFFQQIIILDYNLPLNLKYVLALDGLSISFIILTTFLIIFCVLCSYQIKYRLKDFFILLFIIELFLINVFAVSNLFFFIFVLKLF